MWTELFASERYNSSRPQTKVDLRLCCLIGFFYDNLSGQFYFSNIYFKKLNATDEEKVVKIGDFGESKELGSTMTSGVGSLVIFIKLILFN